MEPTMQDRETAAKQMPYESYSFLGPEFCCVCGKTAVLGAILQTPGRVTTYCKKCCDEMPAWGTPWSEKVRQQAREDGIREAIDEAKSFGSVSAYHKDEQLAMKKGIVAALSALLTKEKADE